MKKVVRIVLAILMVMCLALSITACKSECEKGNHDKYIESTTEATCTSAKVEHWACRNCDWTEDVTGTSLGHDFTGVNWTPSTADETKHARTCTRTGCGYIETANHNSVADPATGGTKCSDCGKVLTTGTVNPPVHSHDYEGQPWKLDSATGKHYQECKDTTCSVRNEHNENWGEYAVKTGENAHIRSCKEQGCTITEEHSVVWGVWTVSGSNHVRVCSDDECALSDTHAADMSAWTVCADDAAKHEHHCNAAGCTVSDVAAHTPEVVTGTPATCTEAGKEDGSKCSVCNAVITEGAVIPALGHDMAVLWTTGDGKHWHECKRPGCDHIEDEGEHTYGNNAIACTVCSNPKPGINFVLSYTDTDGNKVQKGFDTLVEAIASITDDTPVNIDMGTIDGLTVRESTGIVIPSGRNITINFKGKTYMVAKDLVGSTGTESCGFQILAGSKVTLTNGTISAKSGAGVKMLIQNYADLTLDKITLDGTDLTLDENAPNYTLSNNCGNVVLTNYTNVIARKTNGVAFDVWYNMGNWYAEGVKVTVDATCAIDGVIEYGSAQKDVADLAAKAVLTLPAGEWTIRYSANVSDCAVTGITIGGQKIAHNYGEWTTTKQPTCTEEGEQSHECSLCRKTETKAVAATGHKEIAVAVEGNAQKHNIVCSVCKEVLQTVDHVFNDAECVCGWQHTNFAVTDYDTVAQSVPNNGDTSSSEYFVIGKIESISDERYGNMTLVDSFNNKITTYGLYDKDGVRYDAMTTKPVVGDVIVVWGVGNNYKGTIQIKNAIIAQHKDTVVATVYELLYNEVTIDFDEEQVESVVLTDEDGKTISAIDGKLLAKRGTEITATIIAKEGFRIDGVTLNDEKQELVGNVLTFTVTDKNVIAIKSNDVNAVAEHTSKEPVTVKITNKEVGNTSGAYKYDAKETQVGDIKVSYKGVIQGSSDSNAFGFNNSNANGAGGWIMFTAPEYIKKINVVGTSTEDFNFICILDDATEHSISLVSGEDVEITVQAKIFKLQVKSGKACLVNSVTITYGESVICANESTTHHEANPSTCYADGTIEYWECDTCHKYFSDEKLVKEITDKVNGIVDAQKEHSYQYVEQIPATAQKDGVKEHWICTRECCDGHYFVKEGEVYKEVEAKDLILKFACSEHNWGWKVDANGHYQQCSECLAEQNRCDGKLTYAQVADSDKHYQKCTVDACQYQTDPEDHAANTYVYHEKGQHQGVCVCGVKLVDTKCTPDDNNVCTGCGRVVGSAIVDNQVESLTKPVVDIGGVDTTSTFVSGKATFVVTEKNSSKNGFELYDDFRLYANNTLTITIDGGKITKVLLYGANSNKPSASNPTSSSGTKTYDSSANIVTVIYGDEGVSTASFTASGAQVRFVKIEVYYTGTANCFHDNIAEVEDKGAACEVAGNIAHWACPDCGMTFSGSECTIDQVLESVVVPALEHDFETHDRVEPTDTDDGIKAHLTCKRDCCQGLYFDIDTKEQVAYESLKFNNNCEHEYVWVLNADKSHYQKCGNCGDTKEVCNGSDDPEEFVVTSNNNGTHNIDCYVCCELEVKNVACEYGDDGVCIICGDKQAAGVYTLVTDKSQLKDGATIIFVSDGSAAGTLPTSGKKRLAIVNNITIENNEITEIPDNVLELTLVVNEDGTYSFKNGDNYLGINSAGSNSTLEWGGSNIKWNITLEKGEITGIVNTMSGTYVNLRCNAGVGFANYNTSTGTVPQIYIK